MIKRSLLRLFRIVFATIFFLCFFIIFADVTHCVPARWVSSLMHTQFVPSVINFFNAKTLLSSVFVYIVVLTFFTGRSYCSFLCPLGIGQDLFSKLGGRIRKKNRRFGYKKPYTIIRYSVLAVTVVIALFSGIYLVLLLDPYSIFGRFMTFFVKPVVVLFNNLFASVLIKFDIYTLSHINVGGFGSLEYLIPIIFALAIGFLSFTRGRLYCNMICPVGTLLGLISKISVLRIKIDKERCIRCGRCAKGCKSLCIDFLNQNVDTSRCVDCFNCIDTCPEKAITYGYAGFKRETINDAKRPPKEEIDVERRKIITTSAALLLGLPLLSNAQDKVTPTKLSTVKENRTHPVCPPGAGTLEHFNDSCTACSLCINVCPNNVLRPSLNQYGIMGIMQPVMDYHKGFCAFNCNVCTEVCPTNALQPLLMEAKKMTQLGKVNFIKDNCIVKMEKTACGACSESCPTKAVYMIPYEGNLLIPETNSEICIGCGHCEYACPATPYKAIFVDGNLRHEAAKKLQEEKPVNTVFEDFPF